ncbi:MAG: hypothetical protein EXQ74_06360 [Thermoleophilia bacterium]|nr:hypothetical protein [Thermoleophilia bacterium]
MSTGEATGYRPAGNPLFSGDVDIPPAPPSDGGVLAGLLGRATRIAEEGSASHAVVDLAVHAWMEGHVEGEDRCGGCGGRCGFDRGASRAEEIAHACPGTGAGPVPGLVPPGPVPPFPDAADPILVAIVIGALALLGEGRPADRVLPMVAARAWAEGHIEGEERCPGCDWRGSLAPGDDRESVARGHGSGVES